MLQEKAMSMSHAEGQSQIYEIDINVRSKSLNLKTISSGTNEIATQTINPDFQICQRVIAKPVRNIAPVTLKGQLKIDCSAEDTLILDYTGVCYDSNCAKNCKENLATP
jgi:hypothetical protein